MKRRISILILSLLLISAAIGSIYLWVKGVEKHPFTTNSERIEFKVKSGDTLNGVIASLEEQKLLKNQYIVKWYIKRLNLNTKIKPGSYDLSNKITISEFVKDLNSGKYNENAIKVTIPEGYDEVHIAALLEEKGIISKETFIEACKEYSLPDYVKKDSKRNYNLEGYLFPDTYEIIKGTQGKDIIDMMIKNFETVLKDVENKKNRNLNTSDIDRVITMASIVEKEAEKDEERGKVAAVFYNRLNKGMKLQSCATVLYTLGVHKDKLYDKDLAAPGPYNTYIVKALPAGPICSPGRKSIEAAMDPPTTKDLYFVSKNDGTHFFTDSYTEFEKAKKLYQGQ